MVAMLPVTIRRFLYLFCTPSITASKTLIILPLGEFLSLCDVLEVEGGLNL